MESDLDDLISRGTITVIDAQAEATAPKAPGLGGTMTDADANRQRLGDFVRTALRSLAQKAPLDGAEARVPARPGLYAIYGNADSWRQLGLGDPPDGRPLYVGKAEVNLVARDLATHFGDGRTGSSTVRRSFAALLRGPLRVTAQPRNPKRPERFANYGLAPEHDVSLTSWMRERLELAVWPKPAECELALAQIEREILIQLLPPLNLKDVRTPWSVQVKAARAAMADEARQWARSRSRP